MSIKYCLSVTVFHYVPYLTHPAARSLCDADELLFIFVATWGSALVRAL